MVFDICAQVLRQLAPNLAYRSLVMLGIASIQALPVASFSKDDAERLLFFCTRQEKENCPKDHVFSGIPSWLRRWMSTLEKRLVGYSIRFEDCSSARTLLKYVVLY